MARACDLLPRNADPVHTRRRKSANREHTSSNDAVGPGRANRREMDALLSAACRTHGKPVRPHRFWVVKNEDEKTGEKFRWERFIFWREDARREEGTWRAIRKNPPSGRRTGRWRGMGHPGVQLSEAKKDESPRAKAARGAPDGIIKEGSLASLGITVI